MAARGAASSQCQMASMVSRQDEVLSGGDFSSGFLKKGEEFGTSDFETADPAGSAAALRGAPPLDATSGDGNLGLVGYGGKACSQSLE